MVVFASIFVAILATTAVTALKSCGTEQPTQQQIQEAQIPEIHASSSPSEQAVQGGIDINIYYHIIYNSTTLPLPVAISPAHLLNQTHILNRAFHPHNITFHSPSNTATTSYRPDWTTNSHELDMKRALRKGTYADLNIYIISSIDFYKGRPLESELGGIAEFPKHIKKGGWGDWAYNYFLGYDGVVLRSDHVAGVRYGPGARDVDMGMTLVHEAGHWLNLYHTFEGGCAGSGDGVEDTPAEAAPNDDNETCNVGRDTCPGGGNDPVRNYMDYSPDDCYEEFTVGQEKRMYAAWVGMRAPHLND